MYSKLTIETINKCCIPDLMDLWQKQFTHFCSHSDMFSYWESNTGDVASFIEKHAEDGKGVIATINGKTVGYLAYDTFRFHGADSAFIPFPGNATIIEYRDYIHLAMYKALAQKWVDEGIHNHYVTMCATDNDVKNALFDVGFGSYVVDAFATLKPMKLAQDSCCSIAKADIDDAYVLFKVVDESRSYYSESPIFLKMEAYSFDKLVRLINNSNVFIAKCSDKIIGFINLTIAGGDDIYCMCGKGFGQIDEIGVYIKEEYRNSGIGNQFILAVTDYCLQNRVPCVHVDFESANLYANRFWQKYFIPVMLSLKRTIHSDIYEL